MTELVKHNRPASEAFKWRSITSRADPHVNSRFNTWSRFCLILQISIHSQIVYRTAVIGGDHPMPKSVLGYFVMLLDNPKLADFNPSLALTASFYLDVLQQRCLTLFSSSIGCRTPLWPIDFIQPVAHSVNYHTRTIYHYPQPM